MKNKFAKIFIASFISLTVITPLVSIVAPKKAYAQYMSLYNWGKLAEWVNTGIGLAADANNIAAFAGGQILESLITGLNTILGGREWYVTQEDVQWETAPDVSMVPGSSDFDPESGGVLGLININMYDLAQNPPNVKTGDFFYSTLANNIFGIKPARAATGVDSFDAVLGIWKAMRNVAYFLIITTLVVVGFMIMFRYQLGPRAEISVQQAIPKVVVALLLITFSYAIAGFLLDVGTVVKNLIQFLFETDAYFPGMSGANLPQDVTIWNVIVKSGWYDIAPVLFGHVADVGVFTGVVMLVIRLAELMIAFYIFFMLLIRFASLFVYLILSPLAFLWGSIPGQQDTITKWFKSFLVNVLIFPIVYFLFNLSLYIRVLPDISAPDFGMLRHPEHTRMNALLAFGLLLAATKVPAFLEDALDVVPSGHVSKAGVALKKTPLVGKFLG